MKKILIILLVVLSTININATSNDIFSIDIPENFIEEKIEDESNVYKWENKNNDVFHNIIITVDKNNSENKYNIEYFDSEDIKNYSKYIEESINNELKEFNIKVSVSDMKKETINNKTTLTYNTSWPTKNDLGYDTYQKGYIYTTNNYIITLTYTSNEEIKNDDETLNNLINSFKISDNDIEESFLDNKTNRVIITAIILGIVGAFISILIPKKIK